MAVGRLTNMKAVFAVLAMLAVVWSVPASAQTSSQAEARRQALYSQILVQPDNLDASFEYAILSVKLGDYEGAIATLERMLIYSPGLPRVQLELGVLYFRLASYQTAEFYLRAAISGPDVPDEVRTRVSLYLDAIAAATETTKLTTSIFVGARWQSNANLGPGTRDITLNGLPFLLDETATEKSDYNLFAAANFHHVYDLENQGDRIETDLLVYGSFYNAETQLDTQLAELTIGPSFNLRRIDIENTYLGVYAIGNGIFLDDIFHFGSVGAGIKIASNPSVRTKIATKVEYRHKRFNNTEKRPNARLRDGFEVRAVASTSYRLTESLTIQAVIRGTYESADADYLTSTEYGGYLAATQVFGAPFGISDLDWAFNLSGGYLERHYEAPDPTINAAEKQEDKEYWARATLNIPLAAWLSFMPQAEYRKVESNYDIRAFDNYSAIVGFFVRF